MRKNNEKEKMKRWTKNRKTTKKKTKQKQETIGWPLDDDSGIWNSRKNRHQQNEQPKQNKMQETKKWNAVKENKMEMQKENM